MPTIDEVLQQELNPDQQAAASDQANEVLTLACAGSGTSRMFAFRIAWLIAAQGARPEEVVAFTFTEKAADSIKQRVSSALAVASIGPNVLGQMYIGTIHAYCQGLLGQMDARYRQFEVLDENRLKLFLMSRYGRLALPQLRAAITQGRGLADDFPYFALIRETANAWLLMNEEMLTTAQVSQHDPELGQALGSLSTVLDEDEYIDFSLMQRLVVDALQRQNPAIEAAIADLQHLLFDEYQDINPVQDELIAQLHRNSRTLFVVGDDDQSIYGWRGADVSRIINFTTTYPNSTQHTLGTNYRSTDAIVSAADQFVAGELGAGQIAKNPKSAGGNYDRDFRVLWFNHRNDEVQFVVDRINQMLGARYDEGNGQVRGLTPADFAILIQSTRTVEPNGGPPRHVAYTSALTASNIPFSLEAGGGLFDRPHVEVLRDAFELFRNRNPDRNAVQGLFNNTVLPVYPTADFNELAQVMSE